MANKNTLTTDLVVNEQAAFAKVDQFNAKLQNTEKTINDLGKNSELAKNLGSKLEQVNSKAVEIKTTLKEISTIDNKGNSLNWLQTAAVKTKNEITSLRGQIRDLEKAAAQSKSDSSIFNKYEYDAHQLNKELIKAESKLRDLDSIRGKQTPSKTNGVTQLIKGVAGDAVASYGAEYGIPASVTTLIEGKIAALTTATLASIAAIGTLAAAGYAFVKYSESVQAEADRRLKVEESIAAAMSKQALAGQEIIKNFKEQRENALQERDFGKFLQTGSIEELTKRRDLLQKLHDLDPTGDNAKIFQPQILSLDARLSDKKTIDADAEFAERWERFKQTQDDQVKAREEAEKRQIIAQQKFRESVKEGKEKVKEFEKTINEVFDNIRQKTYSDNPIALAMIEGDRATKQLQDTLKTLPPELQKIGKAALDMQEKLNSQNTFRATLDNRLAAFDLQDQADKFRNYKDNLEIKNPEQFFKDYINFYSNKLDGNFTGYAKNGSGGTIQYDLRNDFLYAFDKTASGGTFRRDKTFADLTETEKQNYLAEANKTDTANNKTVQDRLNKQFAILDTLGAGASPEQLALINQKIIDLTNGADPRTLTQDQRSRAAFARETAAEKKINDEIEAKKEREEDRKIRERLAAAIEALNNLAANQGLKAILEIIDKTNGGINLRQGAAINESDTANQYQ